MIIIVQITKVEGGYTITIPETETEEARIAVASTPRQAGQRAAALIETVLRQENL